jgi:hypothetical protein
MTDSQENKSKPLEAPKPRGRVSKGNALLPASIVVGKALLEALKTSLLRPFLIASQTTVANSQLYQNQKHPIF